MNNRERTEIPLQIVAATKRYAGKAALDDFNLTIEPGEIVAIVGLNGAGKSTLLKALAGVIALNSGHVMWNGSVLHREDLEARRRILFIPDVPFLMVGSVMENVTAYLEHYDRTSPETLERAAELLIELDLPEKAESSITELSRGQAYKVGVAAICAVNPDYWLIDEPFASGMDAQGLSTFRREARKAVRETSAAVIYTTQMIELAREFSDRIAVIEHGKLYACDTYENLKATAKDDPKLSRLFD